MTGDADLSSTGVLRAAEALGVARSLRKPFAEGELLAAVRDALGQR
jgi:hypothetical protein